MSKKQAIPLILLILAGIASPLCADTRKGNIELFVLLDKSLSMVEEIESVKEYVAEELVGQLLIPGDMFVLINFYGKTDRFFSGELRSQEDIAALKADLTSIRADGRFTDIGSALDVLRKSADSIGTDAGRRRYLLLLTDGKQEAPPESPYFTPDGTISHEMLEHTKEIVRQGWKIHILGIGTDTAAQELARELSAAFSSVKDAAGLREISESLSGFATSINAALTSDRVPVGSGRVTIPLSFEITTASADTSSVPAEMTVEVESILFTPAGGEASPLSGPLSFTIPTGAMAGAGEGTYELDLAATGTVSGIGELPARGEIRFLFSGGTVFQPAVFDVVLVEQPADEPESADVEKSFAARYWPFLLAALLIVVFAVRMILIEAGKKRRDDDNKPHNPLE